MSDVVYKWVGDQLNRGITFFHFWDGHHGVNDIRNITHNPKMASLFIQRGQTVFLREDGMADIMNSVVNTYQAGGSIKRFLIKYGLKLADVFENGSTAATAPLIDIMDFSTDNPLVIYHPDNRQDRVMSGLNEKQLKVFSANTGLWKKGSPVYCSEFFRDSVLQSLSESEKAEYIRDEGDIRLVTTSVADRSNNTASDDAKIAKNTKEYSTTLAEHGWKPSIFSMTYGWAHYSKADDLNERLPSGKSLGFSDSMGSLRRLYLQYPAIHNNFPDAVYYTSTKQLVEINSDQDKADFLRLSLPDFKIWQKASQGDKDAARLTQVMANLSDVEIATCKAELSKIGDQISSIAALYAKPKAHDISLVGHP